MFIFVGWSKAIHANHLLYLYHTIFQQLSQEIITFSHPNHGVAVDIIRNLLRYIISPKGWISSSRRRIHTGAWWDTRRCRDDIQSRKGWWYAKPAAWINKKGTFGRQKFSFCWRRRRELKRHCRPLASRVVSYRLRLLGSAHSRFGSFAAQKHHAVMFFTCSPLPVNRRGRVQIPSEKK